MRMYRSLLPVLLWLASAQAAVTNIRLVGSTPTQAVIAYTAPDSSACAIEVSESESYTPVVHDVNPELFSSANLDNRPGNVTDGQARTFVIGKRTAEIAFDGKYYSRALQAFTTHYYRIACGSDTATGSFHTQNIMLGGMYKDPYPRDPNHPGRYAWPTIDYTYPTAPGNGTLTAAVNSTAVMFATPETIAVNDYIVLTSGPNAGKQRRVASVTDSRHVTLAQAFSATPAQSAVTWAKRTPEKRSVQKIIDPLSGLLIRRLSGPELIDELSNYFPTALTTVTPGAGWMTASVASLAAADSNVATYTGDANQSWLFVHAPTGFTSYQESYTQLDAITVTLQGSGNGSGNDNNIDLCLTADGATCRSAILTVNLNTCAPWWRVGSTCWVGTEIPLEAAWQSSTDAIGSILDPVEMNKSTGGLLIRKSTATANTVSLDYFGVNLIQSATGEERAYATQICSNALSPQTYNGTTRQGYHCIFGDLQAIGYWIEPTTGDSTVTAIFHGADTAAYSSPNGSGWDLLDPTKLYGNAFIGGVKQIVRADYTGNNLDAGFAPTYAPFSGTVTPLSGNLVTALGAFSPDFAAHQAYWSSVPEISGLIDNRYLGVNFGAGGSQDQPNYKGIYDLQTNRFVAAASTLGYFPTRWCRMHTGGNQTMAGGWAQLSGTVQYSGPTCGNGPFQTGLSEAWGAPGSDTDKSVACPSPMPVQSTGRLSAGGTNRCASVLVDGDLYKPSTTCAAENTLRGANGFLGALQAARIGDILSIDAERVQLLSKDSACSDPNASCRWTVLRAVDGTTAAAHALNAPLSGYCAQNSYNYRDIMWDFLNDPYATDETMTYKKYYPNSHGTAFLGPDPNHLLAVTESAQCGLGSITWGCYATMTGNIPNISSQAMSYAWPNTVNVGPAFASLTGNLGDSHPSQNQTNDTRWILDALTYSPPALAWTEVSGTLWKATATLHNKILATEAFCASRPAVDVSPGPLTAAPSDNYKFCYGAGCYPGAGATDIYMNCPDETTPTCQVNADTGDMCVHDIAPTNSVFSQVGITMTARDRDAKFTRLLGQPFARRRDDVFKNIIALPDGSWAVFRARWMDGMRSDNMMLKLPPWPPKDSINRSTFIPTLAPVGSVPFGTDNVVAEFGYDTNFYCTSRQESCEAMAAAVNETTPFYWASESYSGFRGAPATIAIPAISQRVLYYRLKYRDAADNVIKIGPTQVQVVP